MADTKGKGKLGDLVKRTAPSEQAPVDNSELDEGVIRSTGVGLKTGEIAAIEALAAELGITKNALMRFAMRWFILQYRAGNVDISKFIEEPPPPARKLNMPD